MKHIKILTIGDSHCEAGWNKIQLPNVTIKTNHLGPVLMYTFGKKKLNVLEKHTDIDAVIFCFGEIDIRCHLFKRVETYYQIPEEVNKLVLKYMNTIHSNIKKFEKIIPCVYFIPPTIQRELVKEDPLYPFIGSDIQRRVAVRYMNHRLNMSCKENGFIFVDLYDHYCDKDGYLNEEMSDGSVHIGNTTPLTSFIQKNLLKGI